MKNIFPGALLAVMLLVITGCCKKKIYCASDSVDFAFTGYDRLEARTFSLKKYPIDDYSGAALDSAIYTYNGSRPDTGVADTLQFSDYRASGSPVPMISGFDYVLKFTLTDKQFLFRLVNEDDGHRSELVKCGDNSATCTKAITGFEVNYKWNLGPFLYIQEGEY